MSSPDNTTTRVHEVSAAPVARDRVDDQVVLFLRLDGAIDVESRDALASRLLAELDAPGASRRNVLLDLRDTTVVSAAGIRLLTELSERLGASGRRLLLVAGLGPQRRALDITADRGVLDVYTTVDAALDSLRAGARPRTAGAPTRLAEALSTVARTLEAEPDLDGTLRAIVTAALSHIPGVEFAGISLVEQGGVRTVAPTAELVSRIDAVQYRLQEGPCVDAIDEHRTYRTGDLATEARWPKFGPAAAGHGVRSMLCYRLFASDTTMGALNLYSTRADAFSAQTEQEGQLFATHAAIALIGAQREQQLAAAIEHRDTIAMAKGILMERHDVDPTRAFRMLAEASQHTNMKLYTVAEWLVEHRGDG